MTSAIFDPEAQSEFLSAVRYYEDCQEGLGRRFRLLAESAVQQIVDAPFIYRTLKVSGNMMDFETSFQENAKIIFYECEM